MLSPETQRLSRFYGTAQSVGLCAYAGVYFLSSGWLLFFSTLAVLAGNVLCALGIVCVVWAIHTLRAVVQVAPEPRAGGQLVQNGIYRFLRHPIYTAILLTVVGLFLKKPTLAIAVASVVVVVFLIVKVRFEEKLLLATYPDYADYQRRVPGLLPGLGI